MKFTSRNARKFEWESLRGWAFNEKKDFKRASAAYLETTKSHGKTKNTKSDIVYYIVSGSGIFYLGDRKYSVKKRDVIIIPKNTEYDFKAVRGMLKLFMVHTPAYDPKFDIHFK